MKTVNLLPPWYRLQARRQRNFRVHLAIMVVLGGLMVGARFLVQGYAQGLENQRNILAVKAQQVGDPEPQLLRLQNELRSLQEKRLTCKELGNTIPMSAVIQQLQNCMTPGMALSVVCSEDVDLAQERPEDAALILGGKLIGAMRAQCEAWPKGRRPDDFHTPLKSDLPVLLLSGEYDPVTPPRYGDAVLKGLSRGRHLVALGQGHNVIGRGCMPRLVKRFVEKLETDKLDAGCIADLGPAPFFLGYNGAAP